MSFPLVPARESLPVVLKMVFRPPEFELEDLGPLPSPRRELKLTDLLLAEDWENILMRLVQLLKR